MFLKENNMKLNNKVVCFLGDSITEGVGSTEGNCFVSLFAKAHPEARVYNFGISGTRIAKQLKPSVNTRWDKYFASRIDDMPKNADLIFVFGGTNDFGHGDAPFGELGDTDGYSFSGGLHDLFTRLINKYPFANIVCMTPLHRCSENEKATKPDGEFILRDYVQRIKETTEYFSIPTIDLWQISGIQPSIPLVKDTFMPDGIHPSDAGYKKLFDIVNAYVEAL